MPVPAAAPLNPFLPVGQRNHDATDSKISRRPIQQPRDLLRSIDTSQVVGLRDRTPLETCAMRDSEGCVTPSRPGRGIARY